MKATEVLEKYAKGDRNFQRVNLRGQSFNGKNLAGADFSKAKIHGTDFTGANLTGAKFCGARAGLQKRRMVLKLFIASVVFALSALVCLLPTALIVLNFDISHLENIIGDWLLLTVLVIYCIAVLRKRVLAELSIGATLFVGAVAIAFTGLVAPVVIPIGIVASAITRTVIFTGVVVVILTGLIFYIAWLTIKSDRRDPWIISLAVAFDTWGGTSFRRANLTDVDFTQAHLKNCDFRQAYLQHTCFKNTEKLNFSRPGQTLLANTIVRNLLVTLESRDEVNLSNTNLQGAYLVGANLESANFKQADLSKADLSGANLKNAKFTQSNVIGTNFTHADLTGACLEAWKIETTTIFKDVDCQYIYLLEHPNLLGHRDRLPHNPDKVFAPGDFERLYTKRMHMMEESPETILEVTPESDRSKVVQAPTLDDSNATHITCQSLTINTGDNPTNFNAPVESVGNQGIQNNVADIKQGVQMNSSQSISNVSSSGTGNKVAATQAGRDTRVDQSVTAASVENSELQAALEAISKLKQGISASDLLNLVEKKQIEVTVGMLEEELQKPKPDKSIIDQTVEALKKGLAGVAALAAPVTHVAELVAKAWENL